MARMKFEYVEGWRTIQNFYVLKISYMCRLITEDMLYLHNQGSKAEKHQKEVP